MAIEAFGRWWRASKYVIEAGHLRAHPEASIECYSPWEASQASERRGRGGRKLARPYLALIELADRVSAAWDALAFRGDPGRLGITDWCAQHGLLGIFFLEIQQLDLPPKWDRPQAPSPLDKLSPVRRQLFRKPTRWSERRVCATGGLAAMLLPDAEKPIGEVVPPAYWERDWEPPGALVRELGSGRYRKVALPEALARFFPGLSPTELETYEYPIPTTEDFWRLYGESVNDFVDHARRFAAAVRALGSMAPAAELSAGEQAVRAAEHLQSLACWSSPGLYTRRDGSFAFHWVPSSLLGSYALMAMLDAARGWLNSCARCERVFVSTTGRARYCSVRCRKTVAQASWRARKKERGPA